MPAKVESSAQSKSEIAGRLQELFRQQEDIEAEIKHNMELLAGSNGHSRPAPVRAERAEPNKSKDKEPVERRSTPARKKARVKWEPAEEATVEHGVAVFTKPGKGKKECPNEDCKRIVRANTPVCVCGYNFKTKKQGAAPQSPKADPERVEALKEPLMRITKAAKKGLNVSDATGRLLHQGIKVQDSKDVEKAFKELESEKQVKFDDKERVWLKVA